VDRARGTINGANAPNIRSLLDGLSLELTACFSWLEQRLSSLLANAAATRPSNPESNSFWRLYGAGETDTPAHLEALLSGYAHYARATSDSIEFLVRLGDTESAKVLERVAAVSDKGLWFIELYMEGLALHMDLGHLPSFIPAAVSREPGGTAEGVIANAG
jgi:DNA-binding ferritin-like protein